MQIAARERAALLSFFLPLTRRTCAELGLGDHVIAAAAGARGATRWRGA